MSTNRSQTNREEILNHLLVSIVLANGGTINSNDKNSLLQSWLTANMPSVNELLQDILDNTTGGGSGGGGGFIDYNDTSTTTSALVLTGGAWTTIPNDGLGAFSNDTYKPNGITELMDVSTGAIDPTELTLGNTLLIRNDYVVTPGTNNTLLEFRYTLGTGGGSYTLEKIIGRLDSGSGNPYRFSLVPDLIYMGDLNTRDNPIAIQVRLSANGTLVNAGSVIQVIT